MGYQIGPLVNGAAFPWWVIRKVGTPILTEANFAYTFPNSKFGTLVNGTGSVATDTSFLWGGTGCAKMLTEAVSLSGAEIKSTILPVCPPNWLLAFEQKWSQSFAQGTTEFQVGLEARTNATIYQARFSWTNSTNKWQYESGTGVYSDFNTIPATQFTVAMYGDTAGGNQPICTVDNSALNTTAGTPYGWTRIVIEPYSRSYYSFETHYKDGNGNGYARVWDMRGIALPSNGAASRALYLPFTYVIAHSATAEPGFTTDWCMSIIPAKQPGGTCGANDGDTLRWI